MTVRILTGDCRDVLRTLPDGSAQCCVTSPPYFGLRDYGVDGQIGLETTPAAFVAELVDVFREVRRVLHDSGTLWLNLGDSFANDGRTHTGLKPKDLIGIPWRVAFALQQDGWWLRQDLIWAKPNPMPESVKDRCTRSHEYLFMLTKSARYQYDAEAIAEEAKSGNNGSSFVSAYDIETKLGLGQGPRKDDGKRNKRSVWSVPTKPFKEAHFATFPPALIEPCILAGSREGQLVIDPFGGAGTTGLVADRVGRDALLIELNRDYAAIAERRIRDDAGLTADVQMGEAA